MSNTIIEAIENKTRHTIDVLPVIESARKESVRREFIAYLIQSGGLVRSSYKDREGFNHLMGPLVFVGEEQVAKLEQFLSAYNMEEEFLLGAEFIRAELVIDFDECSVSADYIVKETKITWNSKTERQQQMEFHYRNAHVLTSPLLVQMLAELSSLDGFDFSEGGPVMSFEFESMNRHFVFDYSGKMTILAGVDPVDEDDTVDNVVSEVVWYREGDTLVALIARAEQELQTENPVLWSQ